MFSRILAISAAVILTVLTGAPAQAAARQAGKESRPESQGQTEGQPRNRSKWWQDAETKKLIGLSDEQSAKVEEYFQTSLPELRLLRKKLDGLETELSTMIHDRKVDETVIGAKIDEVEKVRADANKARTLMLYRMHCALSTEQDLKLKELHDKWERERRGRSGQRQHP
jgi:Spy/CpxP family protein refolding chaperone